MRNATDDSFDVEGVARNIVEESLEVGDLRSVKSADGECVECGDEAVCRDPEIDELLRETHAKERFTERHG